MKKENLSLMPGRIESKTKIEPLNPFSNGIIKV